jgi:hypothetical protein
MRKLSEVDSKRLIGLKVFTVGLLIAIAGFALAVAGLPNAGWMIGWGGAIIALAGMGLHLLLFVWHLTVKKERASGPSDR